MIPCSSANLESESRPQSHTDSFTDLRQFLRFIDLEHLWSEHRQQACNDFPFRVSRHYASLINRGDPDDPLLRQVLPSARELLPDEAFCKDPLQDASFHQGNGILRKYNGRALLITTAACPVHCRYCFRRHFPYREHRASPNLWQQVSNQITAMPEVSEIILSGGDPLSLSNERLAELIALLELSPQVQRLRIHTRTPVMLPDRVDEALIATLRNSRFTTLMVTHINHPREISTELIAALETLKSAGITLLNQSVLLKGVNDTLVTQTELCESLVAAGVLPYYLHQLDKVAGASHFYVENDLALQLESGLLAGLPGYMVPRLVIEKPGAASKLPLYTVSRIDN